MRRRPLRLIAAPLAVLLCASATHAQGQLTWKRPTVSGAGASRAQAESAAPDRHPTTRYGSAPQNGSPDGQQNVRVIYEGEVAPAVAAMPVRGQAPTRAMAPARPTNPNANRSAMRGRGPVRMAQAPGSIAPENLPSGGEMIPTPAGQSAPMMQGAPMMEAPLMQAPMQMGPQDYPDPIHSGGYVESYGAPACDCGGGECGCALPEPGCGFVDPSCGVECGCGVPDCGCAADPYAVGCGCGVEGCGGGCGDCVGPHHGWGRCWERGAVPLIIYIPPIKDFYAFGGVHGFKNPYDFGRDGGNFGIHEGFNAGGKMAWLPIPWLGYQVGYQAVHSQLSGDASNADSASHTQHFITAGLFHRRCVGLQYGVVYDFLKDERQGSQDFNQVRGLISLTSAHGKEIGFMFAAAGDSIPVGNSTFGATEQYAGFLRFHGRQGGEVRTFLGGTGSGNGLLGIDAWTPLNNSWSLNTGWAYMVPEDSDRGQGANNEAWNLSMNLVWHYGCSAKSRYRNPFRPMFEVADNGSMIIDR